MQSRILILLEKLEKGELSLTESEELDIWFDSFEDRPDLTASMSYSQRQEAKFRILKQIDLVLDKSSETPTRRIVTVKFKRWISVAAALLVTVVGSYFLWKEYDVTKTLPSTFEEQIVDIPRGGQGATLTLSDGRVVELSTDQSGIRIDQDITYLDGSLVIDKEQNSASQLETEKLLVLQTPPGGTYHIVLSDGTTVWLNAESKLTYPSKFSNDNRRVQLEGEGFFDVTHRSNQPFSVQTQGQNVQVLGTKFNISSYPQEAIYTTLLEGKVRVNAGQQFKVLKPGQQSVWKSGQLSVHDVQTASFVAWKDGEFRFDQTPLNLIMSQLAKWYGIEVVIEKSIDQHVFTGLISRDKSLKKVLKLLEQTDLVRFKLEGKKLYVKAL